MGVRLEHADPYREAFDAELVGVRPRLRLGNRLLGTPWSWFLRLLAVGLLVGAVLVVRSIVMEADAGSSGATEVTPETLAITRLDTLEGQITAATLNRADQLPRLTRQYAAAVRVAVPAVGWKVGYRRLSAVAVDVADSCPSCAKRLRVVRGEIKPGA
jgi:hypothetical protein